MHATHAIKKQTRQLSYDGAYQPLGASKCQRLILTGSQRRARHVTRRLQDWREWTTSQTSESNVKFLPKQLFHYFRYNIEFVKINNKKYARGWGIRSLFIYGPIGRKSHFSGTSQPYLSSRPALWWSDHEREKSVTWLNFLGLPWWRARHQCCHWVSHQWGGAWAAGQDWRGWKQNPDPHHRAFEEWQEISSWSLS